MSDYETSSRLAVLERMVEGLKSELSGLKLKLVERQKRDDSKLQKQYSAMIDAKIKAAFSGAAFKSILANSVNLPLLEEIVATEEKLTSLINRTALKSAEDAATAASIVKQSATSAVDFLTSVSCRFAKG
jgi:hypothetical protein